MKPLADNLEKIIPVISFGKIKKKTREKETFNLRKPGVGSRIISLFFFLISVILLIFIPIYMGYNFYLWVEFIMNSTNLVYSFAVILLNFLIVFNELLLLIFSFWLAWHVKESLLYEDPRVKWIEKMNADLTNQQSNDHSNDSFFEDSIPPVTIMLPLYKEDPIFLKNNLKCIVENGYPLDKLEIYVLDDTPRDELVVQEYKKIIDEFIDQYQLRIVHFRRKSREGYRAGAINDALKEINGKYMILIDIDQQIKKNVIKEFVASIESHSDDDVIAIQARVADTNLETPMHSMQYLFMGYMYNVFNASRSKKGYTVLTGSTICFDVEKLKSIGGFETISFIDDYPTSLRIFSRGYKILYMNEIASTGYMAPTISGVVSQYIKYTQGAIYAGVRKVKEIFKIKGMFKMFDLFFYWAFSIYALLTLSVPLLFLLMLNLSIPLIRFPEYPAIPAVYILFGILTSIPNVGFAIIGLYDEYMYNPTMRNRPVNWWIELALFLMLYSMAHFLYFADGVIKGLKDGKKGFYTTPKNKKSATSSQKNRFIKRTILIMLYGAVLIYFSIPHLLSLSFYAIFPFMMGFTYVSHPIFWLAYRKSI